MKRGELLARLPFTVGDRFTSTVTGEEVWVDDITADGRVHLWVKGDLEPDRTAESTVPDVLKMLDALYLVRGGFDEEGK